MYLVPVEMSSIKHMNKPGTKSIETLNIGNLIANKQHLSRQDRITVNLISNILNSRVDAIVPALEGSEISDESACSISKSIISILLRCKDVRDSAVMVLQYLILNVLAYCSECKPENVVPVATLAICLVREGYIALSNSKDPSLSVQASLLPNIFLINTYSVLHNVCNATKSIVLCCLIVLYSMSSEYGTWIVDWILTVERGHAVATIIEDAVRFITVDDAIMIELTNFIMDCVEAHDSIPEDEKDSIFQALCTSSNE